MILNIVLKLRLIAIIMSLLFYGCATMQSISVQNRTHVYNASYINTFKAAIDYCNEKSFAILQADKDLGIINTDYKEADGASAFFFGNKRVKINLSLKDIASDSTQIIAIISAQNAGAFGSWQQATMSESQAADYYNMLFTGIENQLNH